MKCLLNKKKKINNYNIGFFNDIIINIKNIKNINKNWIKIFINNQIDNKINIEYSIIIYIIKDFE